MTVGRIGVAIGTYGDLEVWGPLAHRARKSVEKQSSQCMCVWEHADKLHWARNAAASRLIDDGAEWLIFLDADDDLCSDYVLEMALNAQEFDSEKYPVLRSAVLGVIDGVEEPEPHLPAHGQLLRQNFVTIGAMHRAEMFVDIGGFDQWPVLEDWAYWLKAWVNGATFHGVDTAVYRIFEETGRQRRNFGDPDFHNAVAAAIRKTYREPAVAKGIV